MANKYWKMSMIPVWTKEDQCEAEIKGPLLIYFWLMFLFQACYHAHITHSVPAIWIEFARLLYGGLPNILDVEHDTNLIIGIWLWI